jgi:two-component system chemotaxis response regulator CheB
MARRDLIVIGASSGGIDALTRVVATLPSGFPAALCVVFHVSPRHRSVLPEILSRAGPLLAVHPADCELIRPAHIYVAPPDLHMTVAPDGIIRLTRGARENNHRPAVDPLFRSAARYYGKRVIGVVLTGALYDGVAGLLAIRQAGGVAVVQDPSDAFLAAMPMHASQIAGADHIVPISEMSALLQKIVHQPADGFGGRTSFDAIDQMSEVVDRDMESQAEDHRGGEVSVFSCPECGGALWQVNERGTVRFRCHVGHAYHGELLLSEQTDALEAALWTAVRTFREKSVLANQLARIEREKGDTASASRFEEQAGLAAQYGTLIQRYVLDGGIADTAEMPVAPVSDGAL